MYGELFSSWTEILDSGVAGDQNLLGRDAPSMGLQFPAFRRTVATLRMFSVQ